MNTDNIKAAVAAIRDAIDALELALDALEAPRRTGDAGDRCEVCGGLVTWVEHLPPLQEGQPARCYAGIPPRSALKIGEGVWLEARR